MGGMMPPGPGMPPMMPGVPPGNALYAFRKRLHPHYCPRICKYVVTLLSSGLTCSLT